MARLGSGTPQAALAARTPLQAMKDLNKFRPDLFKKQPYYLTRCDNYPHLVQGSNSSIIQRYKSYSTEKSAMKAAFPLIFTIFTLTACIGATPQEDCEYYGLTPGTEAFAQCVGAEVRDRRQAGRDALRDFNRANESRGGRIGRYCPIGMRCN